MILVQSSSSSPVPASFVVSFRFGFGDRDWLGPAVVVRLHAEILHLASFRVHTLHHLPRRKVHRRLRRTHHRRVAVRIRGLSLRVLVVGVRPRRAAAVRPRSSSGVRNCAHREKHPQPRLRVFVAGVVLEFEGDVPVPAGVPVLFQNGLDLLLQVALHVDVPEQRAYGRDVTQHADQDGPPDEGVLFVRTQNLSLAATSLPFPATAAQLPRSALGALDLVVLVVARREQHPPFRLAPALPPHSSLVGLLQFALSGGGYVRPRGRWRWGRVGACSGEAPRRSGPFPRVEDPKNGRVWDPLRQ
mmetsp:Transcript_2209/g.5213  ORF Transcript_2209/g.5213 Transcript_2209/m.5213 type:complete len:301 (+) Transcript_2209:673-1575(+)